MRCQPNEIYVHKSEVRILPDHQHGGCISGQKQRSWRPEGSKDAQAATVKGEVWGPRRCAVHIWFYFLTHGTIDRALPHCQVFHCRGPWHLHGSGWSHGGSMCGGNV